MRYKVIHCPGEIVLSYAGQSHNLIQAEVVEYLDGEYLLDFGDYCSKVCEDEVFGIYE